MALTDSAARRTRGDDLPAAGSALRSARRSVTSYACHWHTYYEVELVLDGTGTHILNGREYPLSRGCAYLLKPTDFHEVRGGSPLLLRNVSFSEQMLSDRRLCLLSAADCPRCLCLDDEALSRIEMIAALLEDEAGSADACTRELCECFLSFLLRGHTVSTSAVLPGRLARLNKGLSYLDLHFRESPTLSQIAAVAGLNPTYFSELFRRMTGECYSERLNALRINYACVLLRQGFSVTDACFHSGFGSCSHFLQSFRRRLGMSPREYRMQTMKQTGGKAQKSPASPEPERPVG